MNKLAVNDGLDDIEVEPFDFIWEEWEEYKGDIPLWQHIFCGSIAGIMEHVFMYPLDTLKTYIQTNGYVKNKNSFEKCSIYNCESKNGNKNGNANVNKSVNANVNGNINLKEVNGNNIMYTEKRKFCSSSIGCNSCIYNTSCNYDNIYNVKSFSYFNKKDGRNINTFNKIKIRKKPDINNSFNYSNIKIRDEKEISSCFMNKKLKKNVYLNKIVNNKSFYGNNEYNNQIGVIDNNYKNYFNKLPSTYCGNNKRIKLLMNNIEKYNCSKYYGNLFEKKSESLNQLINKSKKSLKEFTNNEKLNSGKIGDYNINKNYIRNKGIKKLLPFHCVNNKLKLIKSKKIPSKYIIKRNQMCKNECKRNGLKFSNRRIHLFKNVENYKNIMNLNTRDIYVNQLKIKREKNENNLLSQFVHRIKDRKNPKNLMGVNINAINIIKNSVNNVINKYLSNSTNANNLNIKNGKPSFNLSMRKFIYNNGYINKEMNMLKDTLIKWCGNNNNNISSGISTNLHFNSYGRNPFKPSTYKIGGNYFFNILNLHKNNEKKTVNLFPHIIKNSFLKIKQGEKKKEFIKKFEGIRSGFSLISVNDHIKKKDINNFSILRNSNKILFNNICYITKNYKHNRYDKKIYLFNKRNYHKNCHNINSIYSAFNNNLKNLNFVRNIFYGKNINRINISTSQNSGLIKNNVSNLYKGVNVVVLGCIPAHALYFSTFEYSKKYFSNINTNTNPIQIMKTDIGNNDNDDKITKIDYKLNDLNYFSIAICGFLATIAHDLIIAPIDTIKQRMQLGINKSSLDSIKIMKENGIRSLYLSLPITLLMNIPYQIIMICVNEKMKKHYFEYANGINGTRKNNNNNNFEKKKNINIEKISQEDELISNLKNMNDSQNNKLIKQHIEKDIYSMENLNINDENRYMENIDEDSVRYFCENKNNENDLFKNSINKSEKESNNNYLENYNNYKNEINKMNNSLNYQREYFNNNNNIELKNGYSSNYNKNEFFSKYFNHITSYFVCAGIGGGIAAVATNPLDVIKTRIQTECFNSKSFNFFRIVSNLYYKEGCRSFFKGSVARMALCIPASAISWGTYETMKQFFKINFNDA
ncbi:mitochondrial carrier protein [Plasmodium yoelii]|uniref:Mitochondrial carrier protein n=2 Tax=Plasmodium yoelii TaxID=5861 RepID=A0AAF0B0D2_PLAYO|nr:mitochondrial carrier protein [Plasmodium yoelii]WBY55408.1 mitochondrial carrier protein [Plasmodium yoelii yoelii]CDU16565.1 mitochondrial carrier protein, putative [Plasmodium yoelii]VTZ73472.1 mitochondrial carrier protein, putative [Plasmodium yoelii]|eukprot:XP_724857.2 mitochondrial carrier protein [Plasmodium yoelii]